MYFGGVMWFAEKKSIETKIKSKCDKKFDFSDHFYWKV